MQIFMYDLLSFCYWPSIQSTLMSPIGEFLTSLLADLNVTEIRGPESLVPTMEFQFVSFFIFFSLQYWAPLTTTICSWSPPARVQGDDLPSNCHLMLHVLKYAKLQFCATQACVLGTWTVQGGSNSSPLLVVITFAALPTKSGVYISFSWVWGGFVICFVQ